MNSILKNYSIKEQLGEGLTARVYRARSIIDHTDYALKLMRNTSKGLTNASNDIIKKLFVNEINVYKIIEQRLKTNGVTKVYGYSLNINYSWILTEFCDKGEVFDWFKEQAHFPEAKVCRLFKRMMESVADLHQVGIVHRDLKLENFLLGDHEFDVKICDFQTAKISGEKDPFDGMKIGTEGYLAPEILDGMYHSSNDIWSMGCILYLLLSRSMAFEVEDPSYFINLRQRKYQFKATCWKYISPEAKDLIDEMFSDIKNRPTAKAVLEHPWFKKHLFSKTFESSKNLQNFQKANNLAYSKVIQFYLIGLFVQGYVFELYSIFSLRILTVWNGHVNLNNFVSFEASLFDNQLLYKIIVNDEVMANFSLFLSNFLFILCILVSQIISRLQQDNLKEVSIKRNEAMNSLRLRSYQMECLDKSSISFDRSRGIIFEFFQKKLGEPGKREVLKVMEGSQDRCVCDNVVHEAKIEDMIAESTLKHDKVLSNGFISHDDQQNMKNDRASRSNILRTTFRGLGCFFYFKTDTEQRNILPNKHGVKLK